MSSCVSSVARRTRQPLQALRRLGRVRPSTKVRPLVLNHPWIRDAHDDGRAPHQAEKATEPKDKTTRGTAEKAPEPKGKATKGTAEMAPEPKDMGTKGAAGEPSKSGTAGRVQLTEEKRTN